MCSGPRPLRSRPGRRGRLTPTRRERTGSRCSSPPWRPCARSGCSCYGALTGDLIAVSLTLAVAAVMAGVVRWLMAMRREAQAAVLRDVADELARKAEQQATVADLGRQAVANGDEQGLMELAVKVVADSLRADRVAVLELAPGGRDLLLRAESGGGAAQLDLAALGIDALRRRAAHRAEPPGDLRPDRAQGRLLGRHGRGAPARHRHEPRGRELHPGRGERARRGGGAGARGAARGAAPAVAPARECREARRRRRARLQQPARGDPQLRGLRDRGGHRRRAAARPRGALEGRHARRRAGAPAARLQPPRDRWTRWRSTSRRWCATWSRC